MIGRRGHLLRVACDVVSLAGELGLISPVRRHRVIDRQRIDARSSPPRVCAQCVLAACISVECVKLATLDQPDGYTYHPLVFHLFV